MMELTNGSLRGAVLSSYANVAEDGTICFVSDRAYRTCAACGTVFVVSAWLSGLVGPGRCPYCGNGQTAPMVTRGPKPKREA